MGLTHWRRVTRVCVVTFPPFILSVGVAEGIESHVTNVISYDRFSLVRLVWRSSIHSKQLIFGDDKRNVKPHTLMRTVSLYHRRSRDSVVQPMRDDLTWRLLSLPETLLKYRLLQLLVEIISSFIMMTSSNGDISALPVPGEFPAQRPVTRSVDVFFDLRLNKRPSKHWRGWWFETPSCSLWRHCNDWVFSPKISSAL